MKQFIGKIDISYCVDAINQCKKHTVEPFNGNRTLNPNEEFYEDHLEQKRLAEVAGYTKGDSIEFRHYFPKIHFDIKFVDEFCKVAEIEYLDPFSFISEIRPGKCAPWHWDINPIFTKYDPKELVRFVCFIDQPKPGQAFMLEDECFYMEDQGSIYKYPNPKSYHAGFNAGLKTKFLFTITGLQKN